MDRHDAKPRRPSLMAGAEPQQPAAGPQPARILADPQTTPARRRARGPAHLRAGVFAGLAALALVAVGWSVVSSRSAETDRLASAPQSSAAPMVGPSGATLIDDAPADPPLHNPFAGSPEDPSPVDVDGAMAGVASATGTTTGPAEGTPAVATSNARIAANPFNAVEDAPSPATGARRVGLATPQPARAKPAAAPSRSASARVSGSSGRAGGPEPGLLETLMDNIQQPTDPARDTRAMDRLARRLDRAPMPEPDARPAVVVASASPVKATAVPAASASVSAAASNPGSAPLTGPAAASLPAGAGSKAPSRQSLRAMLDQCPSSPSAQGQRCRRQMCQRAGVDARVCLRH